MDPVGAPARRLRLDALPLYVATIAAYAVSYLTQPILPLLSDEFGVSPAEAALTISAVVFAIAIGSVAFGAISDAVARGRLITWTLVALAAATLACAFAPSFGALVLLRAIQGFLVPGVSAVVVAYAGDQYRARDLSSVVGGVIAASVLGGLLGRVGAGFVAALHGWRAVFVVFAALTALAALTAARGLARGGAGSRLDPFATARGMVGHVRDPRLLGAYIVGAAILFAFSAVFTYAPFRLTAAPYHLGTEQVSSIYLVYVAGIAVSPFAGRLSARVPPRALAGVGLAVMGLGIAITILSPLAAIVGGLVVLVTGAFTAQAVVPAFVNVNARERKGSASALYSTFYYAGGTLGSFLPGLAWPVLGWWGVVGAAGTALALGLLANATLCGMRPRAPAESAPVGDRAAAR